MNPSQFDTFIVLQTIKTCLSRGIHLPSYIKPLSLAELKKSSITGFNKKKFNKKSSESVTFFFHLIFFFYVQPSQVAFFIPLLFQFLAFSFFLSFFPSLFIFFFFCRCDFLTFICRTKFINIKYNYLFYDLRLDFSSLLSLFLFQLFLLYI